MTDLQRIEQEKTVLRWGGLAGIIGSILFVVVFFIVGRSCRTGRICYPIS